MTTEIIVPTVGESITEATVLKWLKSTGDTVAIDEPLVELETDKVTVEVNAPASGVLQSILADEEADVEIGAVLGIIAEGAIADVAAAAESEPVAEPAAEAAVDTLAPAVRRLVDEHGLDPTAITASGKDGRLTKGDVLAHIKAASKPVAKQETTPAPKPAVAAAPVPVAPAAQIPPAVAGPREERVRMTRLRKRVAERLKDAQNTAAMLTTFNEVDMTASMEMRSSHNEAFQKKHGVKVGFMSIFAKACVVALQEYPAINAEISGDEIVYKNYYDIGIAVGTEQGLVVPVVRDVGGMGFAQIEKQIREYGARARDGQLSLEELQGGTFTITNGGVYGSMMSTPILNTPQSGILGMHNIVQRPMVMPDGSIQARPMMYIALTYDHRVVDGREAVGFLVRVKECVEDPRRIMLDS
ncbi:MAG: 2-oxoglutarate dehydrogenase complex dihydrolipoyllysine-residue succinyltransferase [Gammaproteobacteria bacterium]|nr:2-oxoglutarate dehydrogenase complex dihydrolipoyllysine-residue succinyltransferase [Gammaproteobacteria bacterium]